MTQNNKTDGIKIDPTTSLKNGEIDGARRNFVKNSISGLVMLFGMPMLSTTVAASPMLKRDDLKQIRQQFIASLVADKVDEAQANLLLDAIKPSGTWADVNYKSTRGGSWETLDHLKRLLVIAKGFQTPSSNLYRNPEALRVLLAGLDHWIGKDYQNKNWWQMRIGIPTNLAKTLILLDEHLPEPMLVQAIPLLSRSQIDMTGQNKVWLSGVVFMRGLLTSNQKDMIEASQAIWSELRISSEEGIQLDYSFHQHGPQLQFTNYGRSFGNSMIMWAGVLHNTPYSMPADKIKIIGDYLLNGPRWGIWQGKMDLNTCGRQFSPETPGNPEKAYIEIKLQLAKMAKLDSKRADVFAAAADDSDHLIGHQNYWRTAFAIHRRPHWYSSLRMSSTHVIGTETANYENMQGRLFGDGCHLTSVSGREYDDIAPLWNWRRLPGITADQKIIEVYPTSFNTEYGRSAFAGGLSSGSTGVSAMKLLRSGISANKAWFFEDDAIVCLGANINGYSRGDTYSSIQQSLYQGNVVTNKSKLEKGQHTFKANDWLHHDNIGYQLLNDSECLIEHVDSNWQSIFPKFSDIPVSGEVFSVWVNHGKSPKMQDYAYILFPNCLSDDMPTLTTNRALSIIANSKRLAAIESKSGIKAVFFKPSKFTSESGISIESDKACIISLNNNQLVVCDPAREYEDIELVINGQLVRVELPQGDYLGSSLNMNL